MKSFTGIVLFILSVPVASAAFAEKRVALVIGNSTYKNIPPLPNPKNDAALMAETLKNVGFEVISAIDVDYQGMRRAVKKFGQKLRSSGKDTVGLFYYAGHGVQAKGANYLIPLGAEIETQSDLNLEALNAADILDQMEGAGNTLNLVILDACRNNPYKGTVRSAGRGLTRINAASGSLIAFAAAPGQVAADGNGGNSPYTKALVKAMTQPGLTVEQVFKRVRISVEEQTSSRQTPWEESSLKGDFYFLPTALTPAAPAAPAAPAQKTLPGPAPALSAGEAERAWDRIKTTRNIRILEVYIKRFRGSFYATLADERIKELSKTRETVVLPPKPDIIQEPPPVQRANISPSFNCYNRLNTTERAICGNSTLAELDLRLVEKYSTLKVSLLRSATKKLRKRQRQWLQFRDRCGASVNCIKNAYYRRLAELNAF